MKLLILYLLCIFYANIYGPPGIAHDSLRSYRGLTLRGVGRGLQSLRSGDALTAFGGGLRCAGGDLVLDQYERSTVLSPLRSAPLITLFGASSEGRPWFRHRLLTTG